MTELQRRKDVLVRRVGVGHDRLRGVFLFLFFNGLGAFGLFFFRRIGDLGGDGDARADLDGRGRLAVRAVLRPVVADVAADERGLFRRGSVVARPGIACCLAAHLGACGPGSEALIGQIVKLAHRKGLALLADRDILARICTDLRRGCRRDLRIGNALRAHDAPFLRRFFLHGDLVLGIIRRIIRHARALLHTAEGRGDIVIDRLDREDDEQDDEQRKGDRVGKADLSEQDADHAEHAAVDLVDPLPVKLSEIIRSPGIVRGRISVSHAGDIGEHDGEKQRGNEPEGHRSSVVENKDPGRDQQGGHEDIAAHAEKALDDSGELADEGLILGKEARDDHDGEKQTDDPADLAAHRRSRLRIFGGRSARRLFAALGGGRLLFRAFGAVSHCKFLSYVEYGSRFRRSR